MADSSSTPNHDSKPAPPTSLGTGLSLTFNVLKKKPAISVQVQELEKEQQRDFITGMEGAQIKRYAIFLKNVLNIMVFIEILI